MSAKYKILYDQRKTNSPSGNSGATNLAPIGDSFLYIETSANNFGEGVACSIERTYSIQICNISFHYNSFSIFSLIFQQNHWVVLEFNSCKLKIHGLFEVIFLKMIDMVFYQQIGH